MQLLAKGHPARVTLGASLFIALAYNQAFWSRFVAVTGGIQASNAPLYLCFLAILVLLVNVLINVLATLLAFRALFKPMLVVLFGATATASYFMNRYGVVIDSSMVQNVIETNPREALGLLNWRMVPFFLLLGLVPSVVVWRIKLTYAPLWHDVLTRLGAVFISLLVAAGLALAYFKTLAPTFREHREMQYMITPFNYVWGTYRYTSKKLHRAPVIAPIGVDAAKGAFWQDSSRRSVTVLVVGETARAQNFSLNGYARETNPKLAQQAGLINFTDVQSCGTATATSVPCVFSSIGREHYSQDKAQSQQGLLDVLTHAGIEVLWRNNNSGCKGVCDRVSTEDFSKPVAGNPHCNGEECFDEHMLDGLVEKIRASKKDMVVVLHQQGSHGPTYWKRYPEAFRRFGPECATSDLQKCTVESVVATYDNTILYTDHFLASTIDVLRKLEKDDGMDTAMLYFSDHGESLGENGLYLHGAPYMFSPQEQRHIPFMVWLSDGFRSRFHIDQTCLAARSQQAFSHDNVFHSVLGMLNIKTSVRNPALDMFHACTR